MKIPILIHSHHETRIDAQRRDNAIDAPALIARSTMNASRLFHSINHPVDLCRGCSEELRHLAQRQPTTIANSEGRVVNMISSLSGPSNDT